MVFEPKDCIWFDYATYDEDGFISGIDDSAPDEVKKAYEKYKAEEEKFRNRE